MFFIRLTRIVPFIVFLAALAVVIYLTARFRLPSARAKQVVIKCFTITSALGLAVSRCLPCLTQTPLR